MRKAFLILALLGLLTAGFGQTINVTKAPATVGVYDKFEASFPLGNYDNPYDPDVINVYADFTAPDGRTMRAIGFYFEDYGLSKQQDYEVSQYRRDGNAWKVRFTPDKPGQWSYVIHAIDKSGERKSQTLSFNCQVKNAEGFIHVANSKSVPMWLGTTLPTKNTRSHTVFTTTKNTLKDSPAKPIS